MPNVTFAPFVSIEMALVLLVKRLGPPPAGIRIVRRIRAAVLQRASCELDGAIGGTQRTGVRCLIRDGRVQDATSNCRSGTERTDRIQGRCSGPCLGEGTQAEAGDGCCTEIGPLCDRIGAIDCQVGAICEGDRTSCGYRPGGAAIAKLQYAAVGIRGASVGVGRRQCGCSRALREQVGPLVAVVMVPKSIPCTMALLRLMVSLVLSVIDLFEEMEPVVPPLPSWTLPPDRMLRPCTCWPQSA